MTDIRVRDIEVGPITLSVTTGGEGPAVLLLHGFPEIAYSWRHQITALANAGFQVIAPDQRGYGWSDLPDGVAAYDIVELVADQVGLLRALEVDQAVVVGHDWGSPIASAMANLRPDLVRALCLMSIPYQPRTDQSWLGHIRATDPDGAFAYMLGFQELGAEAGFEADVQASLAAIHWGASALERPEGGPTLPPHLTAAEFENYARAFARTGFGNGINYYRNIERNWELMRPWHHQVLTMPTLFIGGASDFVCTSADGGLGFTIAEAEAFQADHRGSLLIEGAGHWVQQEQPGAVNDALIGFCSSVR